MATVRWRHTHTLHNQKPIFTAANRIQNAHTRVFARHWIYRIDSLFAYCWNSQSQQICYSWWAAIPYSNTQHTYSDSSTFTHTYTLRHIAPNFSRITDKRNHSVVNTVSDQRLCVIHIRLLHSVPSVQLGAPSAHNQNRPQLHCISMWTFFFF